MADFGTAFSNTLQQAQQIGQSAELQPLKMREANQALDLQGMKIEEQKGKMADHAAFVDLMRGVKLDPKLPASEQLGSLAARVIEAGQPEKAKELLTAAAAAGQKEAMAVSARALEAQRAAQQRTREFDLFERIFGNVQSPQQIPLAMATYRMHAGPEGLETADELEGMLKQHGAAAIPFLHRMGQSGVQRATADYRNAMLEGRAEARRSIEARRGYAQEIAAERLKLAKEKHALFVKNAGGRFTSATPSQVTQATDIIRGRAPEVVDTLGDGMLMPLATQLANDALVLGRRDPQNTNFADAVVKALEDFIGEGRLQPAPGVGNTVREAVGAPPKLQMTPMGAPRTPKAGGPSLDDFLKKAKPKNPNVSDAELRKFWEDKYAD